MSQFFQIHPETPQKRLINQAVDILRKGGVIVYPTDSAYAIGCHLGDKQAADRIKRIRRLDDIRSGGRCRRAGSSARPLRRQSWYGSVPR